MVNGGSRKPANGQGERIKGGTMYQIRVICCVCKKELEPKETEFQEQDGLISHSYCIDCYCEAMRKIAREAQEEDEFAYLLGK